MFLSRSLASARFRRGGAFALPPQRRWLSNSSVSVAAADVEADAQVEPQWAEIPAVSAGTDAADISQATHFGPHAVPPTAAPACVAIRAWLKGVDVDTEALAQLRRIAALTDVVRHPVVAMPDLHVGQSATVGAVIPTTAALIPGAVGVDIGCGMLAVRTSLLERDLPPQGSSAMASLRLAIEVAVPHGRTHNGVPANDAGGWRGAVPRHVADIWKGELQAEFRRICAKRPDLERANTANHLGTLGSGNHFVELCVDETSHVWLLLHSGSRGVGNRIGGHFIEVAKREMAGLIGGGSAMGEGRRVWEAAGLAYLREGTESFDDYVDAVGWAQKFARWNREAMARSVLLALRDGVRPPLPPFVVESERAVNCHHNYVEEMAPPAAEAVGFRTPVTQGSVNRSVPNQRAVEEKPPLSAPPTVEQQQQKPTSPIGGRVWITRKGATSAKRGELAIIPGSMGARSFIVRGMGNPHSYCSCSHGAGRRFSRGEATRRFTLQDHIAATEGIECRKDQDVLDETPAAYKDIDAVMAAQSDLVTIVHTLRQVVCVKG